MNYFVVNDLTVRVPGHSLTGIPEDVKFKG